MGVTTVEWAATIAAAGAVVGSGLTGFITYKVTSRQVSAEDRRIREHRLADTYVDVVRLVRTSMAEVEQTRPRIRISPVDTPPPLSFDEEASIKARLEVFGSHEVRELFIQWRGNLNFFKLAVGELDNLAGGTELLRPDHVPLSTWAGIFGEMNESRDAMRTSTVDIERHVRKELGIAPPDPPDHELPAELIGSGNQSVDQDGG